ncbi:hypothetical protein GCM10010442_05460 [Kitasatospora kifunensis]
MRRQQLRLAAREAVAAVQHVGHRPPVEPVGRPVQVDTEVLVDHSGSPVLRPAGQLGQQRRRVGCRGRLQLGQQANPTGPVGPADTTRGKCHSHLAIHQASFPSSLLGGSSGSVSGRCAGSPNSRIR